MRNLAAIILAAGKGTRMKSSVPKVLHEVAGKPMLQYPFELLRELKCGKAVAVVGHGSDEVKRRFSSLRNVTFVEQGEQLGTGHAVMCAMRALKGFKGDVLILSGDVPLITAATIRGLYEVYKRGGRTLSLITAVLDDPHGYGRVVRGPGRKVTGIVEEKDCSPEQKKINEVNSGIYLVSSEFLFDNIKKLGAKNAQKEYYLPDLVGLCVKKGGHVTALTHIDPQEVMGVNNRAELARANGVMRERINRALMLSGVTVSDPLNTYIDAGVRIAPDTVIGPMCVISGATVIGEGCVIEAGVRITGSSIGPGTVVRSFSIIEQSLVGKNASIGPFARLRPGNRLSDEVRIGNFVEVKKSSIGRSTKANHLSYIGDAVIGEDVNIGAGTITCNYDGVAKHTTVIADGAFIGSDSQLVAPVKVGANAYVGSGTTVTKDVPAGALVITRAKERVYEDWVEKKGLLRKKPSARKKGGRGSR